MTAFAIIVGLVILVGAAFFFGIQIYMYLWLLRDGFRLRKTLEKNNRTISLGEAAEKIRRNEGIIIADAPTLGWNVSRIWWSSDTEFLPRTIKSEEDEFFPPEDPVNYDRFIDPMTGCAKLVSSFVFTQKVKDFLMKHFNMKECPYIFTGGVLFKRNVPKQ